MAITVEGTELTGQKPHTVHERPKSEFDPCCNAKIISPFYLYKHDSPRPSFDISKSNDPAHVALQDLESGSFNLSPSVTQEKREAQNAMVKNRFMFWERPKHCMTKPKQSGCVCLSRLSRPQKILVKILIGLLVIGTAVAIAVGVSIKVGGGVYKSSNSTAQIG